MTWICLGILLSSCGSSQVQVPDLTNYEFAVKINGDKFEKTDSILILEEQPKDQPLLFSYLVNSDRVVVASWDKIAAVSKVEKKEKLDLADLAAGILYSFKVERLLFSKTSLLAPEKSEQVHFPDFQIFIRVGTQGENYIQDRKYLIFLEEIPEQEELSLKFALAEDKKYFRALEGPETLYPNDAGGFHGPPKKGIIEMSDIRHQKLIERIETLCDALNQPGLDAKIQNLSKLLNSRDEEIQENALYAISWLKDLNSK